ncbi:MazG nucleotide pyrophosphohydrolase domain-containing protein [Reinekea blandensis]|uniref:MazG-related protein n=1 Tax=Reinekea blandensis MED297 TaxID=314283 RepID=A4BBS0_9GAMM|nr:MazG nucleotide pyrophosphohydrolase domain-containing protein [Reinekea blandensis]EAR10405.1 mazG-related protein [Reinekea sp. MED297] [Reinekea blandensis MED297]
MADLSKLIDVAKRKREFDKSNPWYVGPESYLNEISKEVDEVLETLPKGDLPHLEEELGDVIWDTLNAILALEHSHNVDIHSILQRTTDKYTFRIDGLEQGLSWQEVKQQEKST